MKLHTKIFEKNEIDAINSINEDFYGYADVSKLQFVINNLISNAVSYIGGEKKRIEIRIEDIGMCYRVFVFNTGDPLPQEVLQKLWDSFYRQDAARLRSEGHFGLGLSIVKAVQDAHSQQCGVNNSDGGIEFWFDIAKGNPPAKTE
jgi:signal transduction histidine kinase